jgi:hypothetical protein
MHVVGKDQIYSTNLSIDLRKTVVLIAIRALNAVSFKLELSYKKLKTLYRPPVVSVCADATNTKTLSSKGLKCSNRCLEIEPEIWH